MIVLLRFAIRKVNKYILYAEGLSKGMQATQSVKWNEMYKWKDDTKYPGYEPELICAQGWCRSHHKWPRNCYQHLRQLGHHTTPRAGRVCSKGICGKVICIVFQWCKFLETHSCILMNSLLFIFCWSYLAAPGWYITNGHAVGMTCDPCVVYL